MKNLILLLCTIFISNSHSADIYYKLDPKFYNKSLTIVLEPTPDPVPEPKPDPVPEPKPDPVPEPTPDPVPEPTPDPVPEPTPDPVPEPTPASYDGLKPITIRANSANHDSKIPYMVDKNSSWSIADFSNAKSFVFTYDKKYQINTVVFGNYCYHPDSAYGRLYYWNYDTNSWKLLSSRARKDYSIRTYKYSTFETDKFLISCTTSRGYINEFRISFQ